MLRCACKRECATRSEGERILQISHIDMNIYACAVCEHSALRRKARACVNE